MRHCEVPAVDVVLDHEKASAWRKVLSKASNHGRLVILEVQRVRQDDAIEQRELKRPREVCRLITHANLGEFGEHRPFVLPQCASVPVDSVDFASRTQEFSERQGERTPASAQVSPD